jgi:hypothetical protein
MSPNGWWPVGYTPPAPAFRRCACGGVVLRTWVRRPFMDAAKAQVVTPCFGLIHQCKKEVETQPDET